MNDEKSRIKNVYRRRINSGPERENAPFSPGHLYMLQGREMALLRMLQRHGLIKLGSHRILEVGCGRGKRLADWLRWGASAEHLHGIDLMETFVREAALDLPQSAVLVGSADSLPYPNGSFDVVAQFMMFTSILDETMRRQAAAEMQRVLAPGGIVLWYDMRYSNPRNPDIRGIGVREIRSLFPGWSVEGQTLTLLPPLARRLAGFSFTACRLLEALIPPLRSHYLAVIRRPVG